MMLQCHQSFNAIEKTLEEKIKEFKNCKQAGDKVAKDIVSAERKINVLKSLIGRIEKVVNDL